MTTLVDFGLKRVGFVARLTQRLEGAREGGVAVGGTEAPWPWAWQERRRRGGKTKVDGKDPRGILKNIIKIKTESELNELYVFFVSPSP